MEVQSRGYHRTTSTSLGLQSRLMGLEQSCLQRPRLLSSNVTQERLRDNQVEPCSTAIVRGALGGGCGGHAGYKGRTLRCARRVRPGRQILDAFSSYERLGQSNLGVRHSGTFKASSCASAGRRLLYGGWVSEGGLRHLPNQSNYLGRCRLDVVFRVATGVFHVRSSPAPIRAA